MTLIKRSFLASHLPKNSKERKQLNESAITSEYMPSYKYVVITDNDNTRTFRSKKDAESFMDNLI